MTQSITGFYLLSQSLPRKRGPARLGTTTQRIWSSQGPLARVRVETHLVARCRDRLASTTSIGQFSRVVAIPRFWTELLLIREMSAPESSSASIMPPVVRKRYTSDRRVDDEEWNTLPLDICTSTRLVSPPGSHLLPFLPVLLSCGRGPSWRPAPIHSSLRTVDQ